MTSVRSERPALTHLAVEVLDGRFRSNLKDFPYAVCLPLGPTPGVGLWVVMHDERHLVTLMQALPNYRLVFLDGRPHPPDPDPTWMGHSVGRWEGDTLVVDSAGFNDKSWFGFSALPHTEKLRITERWTRTTMGSMTVEMAHEDPDTFVRPWKVVMTLTLAPGEELLENICESNRYQELSAGQNP